MMIEIVLVLAQHVRQILQFLRIVRLGFVGDRVGVFVAVGCGGQVDEVGGGAGEGRGAGEEGAGEGAGVGCEHGAGGGEFAVDLRYKRYGLGRIREGRARERRNGGCYLEEFGVHEHALFQASV